MTAVTCYRHDGANTGNYTYDQMNRLKTATNNDLLSAVYTYDAGGCRVRSWDTRDGVVDYVYSGLNILDEVKENVHEKHVYAGEMHVVSNTLDVVEYYHVDHLGSTRLKTAANGSSVYESNYEPFGPSSGESGSEDYRYTGKHEDPSGLYYFGARYYDPLTGRFTTRDTVFGELIDPQSQNRYAYCMNNPHKYTDPDGREPFSVAVGVGFAVGVCVGAIGNVLAYKYETPEDKQTLGGGIGALMGGAVKGGIVGAAWGIEAGVAVTAGLIGLGVVTGAVVGDTYSYLCGDPQSGTFGEYVGEMLEDFGSELIPVSNNPIVDETGHFIMNEVVDHIQESEYNVWVEEHYYNQPLTVITDWDEAEEGRF